MGTSIVYFGFHKQFAVGHLVQHEANGQAILVKVVVKMLVRDVFDDLLPRVFPFHLPGFAMERLDLPVREGVLFQTDVFDQKCDGHNL